jgi:hypothetical protein
MDWGGSPLLGMACGAGIGTRKDENESNYDGLTLWEDLSGCYVLRYAVLLSLR